MLFQLTSPLISIYKGSMPVDRIVKNVFINPAFIVSIEPYDCEGTKCSKVTMAFNNPYQLDQRPPEVLAADILEHGRDHA